MHLKTLTLRGFKSFASATTLHLEPGITCVVGPNGSGKSNVVDALSWVMGEQGAKTLRGGSMSDVIFAGTSSRAPLGRAEVSLTIDNTDGLLPIEYTEVTISRTLFRSGGSEYAINGTPCRLLDIQELLSDTGMGREMHVIVGQGRLDSVLQASAEDRRGFIEEAAGVLKHRRRKEKALRKLEAMAANLARVNDLSTEIRRQLGPLARQADVARRAQVVQADLRDARARLLADDLVQLSATLAQEVADETALRQKREAVEAAQEEARARLTALEQAAAAAAPRLGQATDVWYQLSGLRERLRSLGNVAAERCRLLGTPAAERSGGTEPEELEAQAAAVREQEAALQSELDAARTRLEGAVAGRTQAEEAEREAERALAAV
ncbi:chromosome segregation SMC family protein, partial [Georgenia subflava]